MKKEVRNLAKRYHFNSLIFNINNMMIPSNSELDSGFEVATAIVDCLYYLLLASTVAEYQFYFQLLTRTSGITIIKYFLFPFPHVRSI
jgi:hypothetical protein